MGPKGDKTVVHLFEWSWKDVERECENLMSKWGYWGVQVRLGLCAKEIRADSPLFIALHRQGCKHACLLLQGPIKDQRHQCHRSCCCRHTHLTTPNCNTVIQRREAGPREGMGAREKGTHSLFKLKFAIKYMQLPVPGGIDEA